MKAVRVLGKLLISLGTGVLLFVVWTLWGTGILTAREQERLTREFDALPALPAVARQRATPTGPPQGFAPKPGEPVFRLQAPSIGLDHIVVEGVGEQELRLGPGHYPSCRDGFTPPLCTEVDAVWPGEKGRVIVSGHRTTHGAPFWDLDKLSRGDEIVTRTRWGDFTYVVSGKEVVAPNARDIANPEATDGYEVAFTTCHPRFSAAQRLIVFAEMEL